MNTSRLDIASSFTALGLAVVLTLAMLGSVNFLATSQPSAEQLAHATSQPAKI